MIAPMPFRLAPDATNRTVGPLVAQGTAVSVICDCGHLARIGREALEAMSPDTTVDQIASRLRCSTCGGDNGLVGMINGGWGRGGFSATPMR